MTATRVRVRAASVAVRVPASSSSARSPTIEPGPSLADVLAVDFRDEHAVEDEVELVAGLALLDEDLADVQLAPGEIGVAAHELARELPFERALRRRHERLGLLVAPRRVLAVRLAIPGDEIDRPGLAARFMSLS